MDIPVTPLTHGKLVNDRYLIEHLIGQGGMGAVYAAFDQRLKSTVALKQTMVSGEQSARAFEREAQLLARLRHPVLPKVIDYFADEDGQFLVMEFFPGQDLAHMLDQRGEPFSVDQVREWADQLLGVLSYLHQQQPPVLHRDIKPQNLKLTPDGTIVLLDFGLAKGEIAPQAQATKSGSLLGYTPMYAPLEQIQGVGTSQRSDLYALAATLYHLLTASPPTDTLSRAAALVSRQPDPQRLASEVNPDVPPALSALLAQALSLDPEERPDSAETMRAALADAAQEYRRDADPQAPDIPRAAPAAPKPWERETQYAPAQAPYGHTPPSAWQAPQHPSSAPMDVSAAPGPQPATTREQRHGQQKPAAHRSFFWPIMLIGVGTLWLLNNLNLGISINFSLLWQLWPVWLIIIGLDIMIGRRSPRLKALTSSLAAIVLLALVVVGSMFNLGDNGVSGGNVEHIKEPIDGATSADVRLNIPAGDVTVGALDDDSPNLVEADLTYRGDIRFKTSGEAERVITLDSDNAVLNQWWNFELSPNVPVALDVSSESGETRLDLTSLQLTSLSVDGRGSDLEVTLPATDVPYNVAMVSVGGSIELYIDDAATIDHLTVDNGRRDFEMEIGDDVALTAAIQSNASNVTIDVPDEAAVHLVATNPLDSIEMDEHFQPTQSADEVRIWESANFDEAERKVVIDFDGGAGNLEVR